jgi:hypothetical protein
MSHTFGKVDGSINNLNCEISSDAKGREQVHQTGNIDEPLWTNDVVNAKSRALLKELIKSAWTSLQTLPSRLT